MVALRAQMAHTQIPPQKPMVLSSFSSCAFAPASAEANRIHTEAVRKRMQKKLYKSVFMGAFGAFFPFRQPNRQKVTNMTSQSPSGTLPGTRQEGKIGLLVALGAFQGRFWTPKGGPNGTQNRSKIDLGDQGGPNSRPSEAHKHTKKLFENTGQKVFRNRFTQDPPTILGSVAGIGGAAPLEIRPLSRSGSTRGRGAKRMTRQGKTSFRKPPTFTEGKLP